MLIGCGASPAPKPPAAPASVAAPAPVIDAAGSRAALCAVARSYAPMGVQWALQGCPPDPEPVPAALRACRVHWGDDTMTLGYDAAGRLASYEVLGAVTRYVYADGRLAVIEWSGGAMAVERTADTVRYPELMVTFTVEDGHLAALDNGHDVWTWTFAGDRPIRCDLPFWDDAIDYEYDARGLLVTRRDNHNTWHFHWDALGRPTAIDGWDRPVTIDYDCDAR